MTTRTDQAAARRGHPEAWTYDDVTVARLEANATARPRGFDGPSPDALSAARTPVTPAERQAFHQTVRWTRTAIELALDRPPALPWTEMEERALNRQAISRALVEHGYLRYTRRRICPPIPKRKAARIM